MRQDVYETITNRIIADLEQGVRPWMKPWDAEHAAGRIVRPLRARAESDHVASYPAALK